MYFKISTWLGVVLYFSPMFLTGQSLEMYTSNVLSTTEAKGIGPKTSILSISKNEHGLFVLTDKDGCYQIDQRYKRTALPIIMPIDRRDHFEDILYNEKGVYLSANENEIIPLRSMQNERQLYGASSFVRSIKASQMVMDEQENIYIGTENKGIYVFSKHDDGQYNEEPKKISIADNQLPSNTILCLYKAPDQTIWVGTGEGLASIRNEHVVNHGKNNKPLEEQHLRIKKNNKPAPLYQPVHSISTWGDNLIWAGEGNLNRAIITKDSIRYLHEYPLTDRLQYPIENIKDLMVDLDGNIWLAANQLLRYNITTDQLSIINEIYTIKSQGFLSIEEDLAAGKIWIGTQGGGLYQLNYW